MKKATQLTVNEKKQRAKLKMNFQATSNSQAKKLTDSASARAEICDEVSDIVPRSPLTKFMDAKWKKREFMESVSTLQECIESLNVCCDLEIQFQL